MGNILQEGLMTSAIGIGIVLMGLILLVYSIKFMELFTVRGKKEEKQAVKTVVTPLPVEEEPALEDTAHVAAITAAISLLLEKEGNKSGFIVRRIRRN